MDIAKKSIKIADFGLMKKLQTPTSTLTSMCGTPEYAATEVLLGLQYNTKSDLFSLGVVVYILLVGTFPFSLENALELQNMKTFSQGHDVRDMKECLRQEATTWSHVSQEGKDFIIQLLKVNASDRMDATMALTHPFLSLHEKGFSLKQAQEYEISRKHSLGVLGIVYLLQNDGFQIIKHGRKGKPHYTMLYYKEKQRGGQGHVLSWDPKRLAHLPTTSSSNVVEKCLGEWKIVLGRSSFPQEKEEEYNSLSCLSLIGEYRSLHIELSVEIDRDIVIEAFSCLHQCDSVIVDEAT